MVNLAGEPLMGGRWTAARRAVLEGSRIAVTEQLVRAMAEAKSRPRVFISGSAVGALGTGIVNEFRLGQIWDTISKSLILNG